MKIHDRYCQGLIASSDSHRRTVAGESDAAIPSSTAWRASSGHDHRDSGRPLSAGGVQAIALTWATCTSVNSGGRPDRFASASDAIPGAVHQRWRHLRTVSSLICSRGAICVLACPAAAARTIAARITSRCSVRAARVSRVSSRRCEPVNVIWSVLVGDIRYLTTNSHWPLQPHPPRARWWSTTRRSGRIGDHGRTARLDESIPATAAVRSRAGTMATAGQCRCPVPRRVRLRQRNPARRRAHAADAAALRRISCPLGLRDLPRQQGRLRGFSPANRIHSRRTRRRPRHRLRPLPRRSNRLDITPDELTTETTKAQRAVDGHAPVKRNRYIQLSGATKSVNRTLEAKTRALAGWKGYTTNLVDQPAVFVIDAYHQLWHIEKAFRISKHDLAARPIYHHLQIGRA